ncbi:transcriptional modulator of MazE/toxin, MazF [Stanieria sp. NIES-3757]|nr:transcriptional modulator of MazE/toxin, MazF [Stanieria sp. NIES-3757]
MVGIKQGLIIDIDLNPVKGAETGKIRPCIVVTNDIYNQIVPVIQVVPITQWSEKKARVKTNVAIAPSTENGLTKKSIADCLQTRPVDYKSRVVKIRGQLELELLEKIDTALKIIFAL